MSASGLVMRARASARIGAGALTTHSPLARYAAWIDGLRCDRPPVGRAPRTARARVKSAWALADGRDICHSLASRPPARLVCSLCWSSGAPRTGRISSALSGGRWSALQSRVQLWGSLWRCLRHVKELSDGWPSRLCAFPRCSSPPLSCSSSSGLATTRARNGALLFVLAPRTAVTCTCIRGALSRSTHSRRETRAWAPCVAGEGAPLGADLPRDIREASPMQRTGRVILRKWWRSRPIPSLHERSKLGFARCCPGGSGSVSTSTTGEVNCLIACGRLPDLDGQLPQLRTHRRRARLPQAAPQR
jgi:hypothetical protein